MPHPIVHAEIRSTAPDATRKFFADLLGWTYPDEGQSRSLVGRVLASESIY
jgi:predicted enzyme related to lactoylglutathione lyase